MTSRASRQCGFTIPEVLLALMVLLTASTATMAAVGSAKRTTAKAQRSTEAARVAQSTLDSLKDLEYRELGLTQDVVLADLPPGEESRLVNTSELLVGNADQVDPGRFVPEQLVQPGNGGALDDPANPGAPGKIEPGPEQVTISSTDDEMRGTKLLVYKYVTWHDEQCFGSGPNNDLCPTIPARDRSHDVKRIVIAVIPGEMVGGVPQRTAGRDTTNTVWASTLVADPSEGAVDPPCTGSCGAASGDIDQQEFYMYDIPCAEADVDDVYDRYNPSHDVHRTSVEAADPNSWANSREVSACRNETPPSAGATNWCFDAGQPKCRPDLLSIHPPGVACPASDPNCEDTPITRYSQDLRQADSFFGYGPFSVVMKQADGCTYSTAPGQAATLADGADPNDAMVHTWSTNKFSANDFEDPGNTEGFVVAGGIRLQWYVGIYGTDIEGLHRGRICVTLIDRDEGADPTDPTVNDQIIWEFTCDARWPIGRKMFGGIPGDGIPETDARGGVLWKNMQVCSKSPEEGKQNTFRDPSDPLHDKVKVFPPGGWPIPRGHRLVVRLAVDAANTPNPLVFYYGQEDLQSKIVLGTTADSRLVS